MVPAGGEFADTGVVDIPNELADQIADFKVLGPWPVTQRGPRAFCHVQ